MLAWDTIDEDVLNENKDVVDKNKNKDEHKGFFEDPKHIVLLILGALIVVMLGWYFFSDGKQKVKKVKKSKKGKRGKKNKKGKKSKLLK